MSLIQKYMLFLLYFLLELSSFTTPKNTAMLQSVVQCSDQIIIYAWGMSRVDLILFLFLPIHESFKFITNMKVFPKIFSRRRRRRLSGLLGWIWSAKDYYYHYYVNFYDSSFPSLSSASPSSLLLSQHSFLPSFPTYCGGETLRNFKNFTIPLWKDTNFKF